MWRKWVSWFNEERLNGELADCTPAEVEGTHYPGKDKARAA